MNYSIGNSSKKETSKSFWDIHVKESGNCCKPDEDVRNQGEEVAIVH